MKKKILVVDDSQISRGQVKLALEAEFEVIEAWDGVDGLSKLDAHRDVAMIICDINMPRMNGLVMIEAVKGNPIHDKLPLLMLTTEGHAELIERAVNAGAKGWMVKPFKPALLLAAVKRLTGLAGGGATTAAGSPAPSSVYDLGPDRHPQNGQPPLIPQR